MTGPVPADSATVTFAFHSTGCLSLPISALLPIRLTQHSPICCGGARGNPVASARLPEEPRRVPGALCHGRRVPTIPHGVALAERVPMPSMPTRVGVCRGARDAAPVPGVPLPGLGHGG